MYYLVLHIRTLYYSILLCTTLYHFCTSLYYSTTLYYSCITSVLRLYYSVYSCTTLYYSTTHVLYFCTPYRLLYTTLYDSCTSLYYSVLGRTTSAHAAPHICLLWLWILLDFRSAPSLGSSELPCVAMAFDGFQTRDHLSQITHGKTFVPGGDWWS